MNFSHFCPIIIIMLTYSSLNISRKEGIVLRLDSFSSILYVGRFFPAGLVFQGPSAVALLQILHLVLPLSLTGLLSFPVHGCMLALYVYMNISSGLTINFCLCIHSLPLLCLRQGKKKQQQKKNTQIPPSSDFCSIQTLDGLNDAHPHWREQSTLLSALISSGNTLIDTWRNKVSSLGQSSWHNNNHQHELLSNSQITN